MLTVIQYSIGNVDLMGYRIPDYIKRIYLQNVAALGRFMKGLGLSRCPMPAMSAEFTSVGNEPGDNIFVNIIADSNAPLI